MCIRDRLHTIQFNKIREIFLQTNVSDPDDIEFNDIDYTGILSYLSRERDFSEDRVNATLNRLKKGLEKRSQTLEKWF